MLDELSAILNATPDNAVRADYARRIVEENILFKATFATRKLTNQRLGELYGLDPKIAPFRVLRKLWNIDKNSQPLLALLLALARDPLLLGTAEYIISMKENDELSRATLKQAISDVVSG